MVKVLTYPWFIAAFLAFVFALNALGVAFGWYLSLTWLDNLHHALGGFWIGILAFYLTRVRPRLFTIPPSFLGATLGTLALTALAGVLWEIYEFGLYGGLAASGVLSPRYFGHADTISDLIFDLSGALVAVVLAWKPAPRS